MYSLRGSASRAQVWRLSDLCGGVEGLGSGENSYVVHSTFGFGEPYDEVFAGMAVGSDSWGAIKSFF